jgi:hypothetical protein
MPACDTRSGRRTPALPCPPLSSHTAAAAPTHFQLQDAYPHGTARPYHAYEESNPSCKAYLDGAGELSDHGCLAAGQHARSQRRRRLIRRLKRRLSRVALASRPRLRRAGRPGARRGGRAVLALALALVLSVPGAALAQERQAVQRAQPCAAAPVRPWRRAACSLDCCGSPSPVERLPRPGRRCVPHAVHLLPVLLLPCFLLPLLLLPILHFIARRVAVAA